jgi:hypothetical protein
MVFTMALPPLQGTLARDVAVKASVRMHDEIELAGKNLISTKKVPAWLSHVCITTDN